MKKIFLGVLFFTITLGGLSTMNAHANQNVLSFEALDIKNNNVDLSQYKGKVLMIVNTASKCGFTPQYADLQKLYETYQNQGFEVLAFPANNFGAQEPGTNEEIEKFCDLRFKISFPLFSKINVKGKDIHPLYKYLTEESDHAGVIEWNFTKFLVDKNGAVVARYNSSKNPMSDDVKEKIEGLLSA